MNDLLVLHIVRYTDMESTVSIFNPPQKVVNLSKVDLKATETECILFKGIIQQKCNIILIIHCSSFSHSTVSSLC